MKYFLRELPDVHDEKPSVQFHIDGVGITNYKIRVVLCNNECIERNVKLDIYVDLPEMLRGVHLSRFIDVIEEVIGSNRKHRSLWSLLKDIAWKTLDKHKYSSIVSVYGSTEIVIDSNIVDVKQGVILKKQSNSHDISHYVYVSFKGVTACPCVQKVYSFLEKIPLSYTPTHMQRTKLVVELVIPGEAIIDPLDIYRVVGKALSGYLRSKLKRYDEYLYVKEVISKARFVEDVVRYAVKELYSFFADKLPGKTKVFIEARSEESIHVFDTIAFISISMDRISNILTSNNV